MDELPTWLRPQVSASERIAFLEMLAQVVLLFLRLRKRNYVQGNITLHHVCDNAASVGAVQKFFTTAKPLCYGLQALSWYAAKGAAEISISHIPGEKNVLADHLSRWWKYPATLRKLNCKLEITDLPSLRDLLDPVWVFMQAEV